MDHLIFHMILLCISPCLGLVQNQGSHVFEPTNLTIYSNDSVQQLLLEWDISDYSEAYNSHRDIIFNIEIRLREEDKRILLNVNYTTTLNKSKQHYQWSFFSEVPLQCATHEARIRSRVASSKIWSDWTNWEAANGPNALSNERNHIFPEGKVFERGSNITVCCIAKKNEHVTSFTFYKANKKTNQPRILFTKKPGSSFPGRFQVACGFNSGIRYIYLYLTRQPDKPQNLTCETEDMINIRCTWDSRYAYYFEEVCPMEFILSDVSSTKIYCSTKMKISCSFKMGNQFLYNVRLTSRNCFGRKHEQFSFDVNYSAVRPVIFSEPSVDYLNSTFIQLSCHIKPIHARLSLLCQINVAYAGGNKQYNVIVPPNSDFHPSFQLDELQPGTRYTLKVRCAVHNDHFRKWGEWTETISANTHESAPSGLLDVWRIIHPGLEQCNVTVFWRKSSEFRANGIIQKYHLSWESLEEPWVQHHNYSAPASQNYTTISLGNHSYEIHVRAQNSVSTSSFSLIIIPATNRNGKVHYSEETRDNNETRIHISWKTQSKFNQYVVDWCNQPTSHFCDFQWKKYGQNISNDNIISGAFRPGIRYTFNVYGIQDDISYLLEKKVKYLKELEPTDSLSLNIDTITMNSLTVSWRRYDQEFSAGFIRGYILYMKKNNQSCIVKESKPLVPTGSQVICMYNITKPNQTELTVRHLEPNTKYLLAVKAYTVKSKYNDNDNFTSVSTSADKKWPFPLIHLLVSIPLMLTMCMCFERTNCLKNCLCPAIPQPKVTPFLKMSPGIIEVNDTIPDQLVMLEEPREFSYKQSTLGILLENMTYSQSFYYPEVQLEERTNQKFSIGLTSYKPLQDFGFTSSPNPCTSKPPSIQKTI